MSSNQQQSAVQTDQQRIEELEQEIENLRQQAETQIDTISKSYAVTDEAFYKYFEKHNNTDIVWDDTGRCKSERQDDIERGFLAEAVLVEILEEKIGEENVDWRGENGEVDITVYDELNIEVKCRRTDTQRNLIIDEGKLDHDDVDVYVHTVMQRDDRTGDPAALEVLGYVTRHDALDKRILVNGDGRMYGYSDEEKYEVHPKYLTNIQTFLDTLKMFRAKPEQINKAFD